MRNIQEEREQLVSLCELTKLEGYTLFIESVRKRVAYIENEISVLSRSPSLDSSIKICSLLSGKNELLSILNKFDSANKRRIELEKLIADKTANKKEN